MLSGTGVSRKNRSAASITSVPIWLLNSFCCNSLCLARIVPQFDRLLVILQGTFALALQIVNPGKIDIRPYFHRWLDILALGAPLEQIPRCVTVLVARRDQCQSV